MLFADLLLARRLEEADAEINVEYAQAQAGMYPELGSAAIPVGGGYAVYAGEGSPLSRTVGLGMKRPMTEADMDQVEAFYRERGASFQIDLCPLADKSLRELLNRRSYSIVEFSNVWITPLDDKARGAETPLNPEIRVERITPDQAAAWSRVVGLGFSEGEPGEHGEADVSGPFTRLGSGTCFLASVGEEPAGGGAMAICQNMALLFTASTLPQFRNLGVQTALLQARLAQARAAGCDLAVVQTEPGSGSQRNVERAGFRLAYTKLTLVRD